MMREALETFVHDTLDSMGAIRMGLNSGAGIWRADLSPFAARFLGRSEGPLLYTFDLDRWEEGTRLECLTPLSPLVQRLQTYSIARGALTVAHLPSKSSEYQPYLAAYFTAVYRSDSVHEESEWLAAHIPTGAMVKIKRDPFDSDLAAGVPARAAAQPTPEMLSKALGILTDAWNRYASAQARQEQSDIARRYRREASDISAACKSAARAPLLNRLACRLHLHVECDLQMAAILWLPA